MVRCSHKAALKKRIQALPQAVHIPVGNEHCTAYAELAVFEASI